MAFFISQNQGRAEIIKPINILTVYILFFTDVFMKKILPVLLILIGFSFTVNAQTIRQRQLQSRQRPVKRILFQYRIRRNARYNRINRDINLSDTLYRRNNSF